MMICPLVLTAVTRWARVFNAFFVSGCLHLMSYTSGNGLTLNHAGLLHSSRFGDKIDGNDPLSLALPNEGLEIDELQKWG